MTGMRLHRTGTIPKKGVVIGMKSVWRKRIGNLLSVKSIVTLVLTGVFAFLAVSKQVSSGDFLTIFTVIIAFYFGTQSQKTPDPTSQSPTDEDPAPPS